MWKNVRALNQNRIILASTLLVLAAAAHTCLLSTHAQVCYKCYLQPHWMNNVSIYLFSISNQWEPLVHLRIQPHSHGHNRISNKYTYWTRGARASQRPERNIVHLFSLKGVCFSFFFSTKWSTCGQTNSHIHTNSISLFGCANVRSRWVLRWAELCFPIQRTLTYSHTQTHVCTHTHDIEADNSFYGSHKCAQCLIAHPSKRLTAQHSSLSPRLFLCVFDFIVSWWIQIHSASSTPRISR